MLTNTASSVACNICGSTPVQMNHVERYSTRECDTGTFQYGLSTLHAWIRLFEYVLHVAYRRRLKVWTVQKKHREEFKREITKIQKTSRTRWYW